MKIITSISSIASIIGFLSSLYSQGNEISLFQILCLILFFGSSCFITCWFIKNRPKTYDSQDEIEDYMYNWISKSGRSVIFTRDMSWCKSDKIKNLLKDKARSGDLILLMQEKTDFASSLESEGAEVYDYTNIGYTPAARFTIAHYGRGDAKVAIGRTDSKGKHRIEEFEGGVHPQFHLADDLVNILKLVKR